MAGPLAGIRVLDLSRVLAGPWCTQILADLGAEIIKVERPGTGDDTRQWGPPWLPDRNGNPGTETAYFQSTNRGKHSLTLDIGRPEGHRIALELAAVSDVFIENFRTGGLAAKGLGYDDLRARKPDIIYCSITGFGQTGPQAGDAGYDYMIQGMGGLMSITGVPDGEPGAGPQRVGVAVSDLTTGMYAAIAILGALLHRAATGEGQYIDMALLDVQVSWLANQGLNYLVSGKCPVRTGARHPNLAPYETFPTSDGWVIIAIGNDGQFQRFCREIGRPELAEDHRFRGNPDRVANQAELGDLLAMSTVTRSSEAWIQALKQIGVPCGPINSIADVFDEPQVKARGMRVDLEHPLNGTVTGIANPIRYSKTPVEYKKAPPLLGEDTDEVLKRLLNKSDAKIAELRKAKVI